MSELVGNKQTYEVGNIRWVLCVKNILTLDYMYQSVLNAAGVYLMEICVLLAPQSIIDYQTISELGSTFYNSFVYLRFLNNRNPIF